MTKINAKEKNFLRRGKKRKQKIKVTGRKNEFYFLMILVNVPIIQEIQTAPTLIFPYFCVNALTLKILN